MTKQRGIKIAIICAIIIVLLVGAGLIIYFNFFGKSAYRLVDVELTDYTANDYASTSEIEFHKNGTFCVRIEHKKAGLIFTGIGTYELEGKTYQLNFVQAYARDTANQIKEITNECKDIICTRSGNRIKFVAHNAQIYYFG